MTNSRTHDSNDPLAGAGIGDVVAERAIGPITAADALSLAALTLEFNPEHLFGGESAAGRAEIPLSPVWMGAVIDVALREAGLAHRVLRLSIEHGKVGRLGDTPVCTALLRDRRSDRDETVLSLTVTDSRGRLLAKGEAVLGP